MANTNAPFGFSQLVSATGAGSNFEQMAVVIDKDDTTNIFTGDPVKRLDTGYIAQWTAATAVSQLAGIFVGCEYLSVSQGKIVSNSYWPGADAAADVTAFIIPCNLAIPPRFLVQSDATGVAFADIGQNVDVALGTGNTRNGRSGAYLNVTSTLGTTATLPFRIEGLYAGAVNAGGVGGIGNGSQAGAYNLVIVRANVSGAGSTGI